MKTLRVLIVDDSPVFLKAAVSVLMDLPYLEIVGQASSGPEALHLTAQTLPNLVLTDLDMPQMDGFELTRRLLLFSNPPKIVIMTAHTQPHYRAAAEAAGVAGFVLKANLSDEIPTLLKRFIDSGSEEHETQAE